MGMTKKHRHVRNRCCELPIFVFGEDLQWEQKESRLQKGSDVKCPFHFGLSKGPIHTALTRGCCLATFNTLGKYINVDLSNVVDNKNQNNNLKSLIYLKQSPC